MSAERAVDSVSQFAGDFVPVRRRAAMVLVVAVLDACGQEPLGLLPTDAPAAEAFVSDPVSSTAASSGMASISGADVVYVSLPPGSTPSGTEAEVRNITNGANERIPIVGGGFDPVPIAALPGDALRFQIFVSSLEDEVYRPSVVTEWTETVPLSSPPIIVRTYPGGGKRDVPVALSVLVVFSEPMDGLSTDGESVELLFNGEPVPVSLNLSQDGLRLALTPTSPLAANTQYVLRIGGSIEDLDRDRLGHEEQIVFTTGSPGSQLVLAPSESCDGHPLTSIPTFEDANLEGAIRATLGFGAQDILTCEIVADLRSLSYSSAPYQTNPPPTTAVRSLAGIQNLTGLTRLVLANHALTDIGPLSGLTQLDTLSLPASNLSPPTISSVAPLAGLTGLRYVNLSNTVGIVDLNALRGLTRLSELHIRFNAIEDLGPLAGLTSLTHLNVAGNALVDVSPLAGLTNLTWLSINFNAITDIGALSGLTRIGGTLWLPGNEITDLAPIGRMTDVRRLYASSNNLTRIDGLEQLANTTYFLLSDNPNLTNIAPLLANPGVANDTILITNTSVTCADVQRLQDAGAEVSHTCGQAPVSLIKRPLAQGTVGEGYFEVLMATGGTGVYTWSGGGGMPAGLTLSASGVISGVPTVAGRAMAFVNLRSGSVIAYRQLPIIIAAP